MASIPALDFRLVDDGVDFSKNQVKTVNTQPSLHDDSD
jgi:hypothetical protein